jgi:hypothetical protein
MQDCPKQGTVSDLLEWAIQAKADHQDQDHEGPARDKAQPAGFQHRGKQVPHSPGPKRSTRAEKG